MTREALLAELYRRRAGRAGGVAACLGLWLALYGLTDVAPAPAREVMEIAGDLLGLAAAAIVLTTPWTAVQREREADRRLRRLAARRR